MNRTKLIAIGLIAIIVIAAGVYFVFTGMGPSEPTGGGTLTMSHPIPVLEDLGTLGTGLSIFPPFICFDQAFEPFMMNGELVPSLCESWEQVDDVTYVFNIREGVLFHDGEEMTAEDWKFTFELYANPPAPSEGAPPPGQLPWAKHIIETEVVDKYTIKIVTDVPFGVIPEIFTQQAGNMYIMPKKAYEELGDDFKWNPIGTGPYKFVEHVTGEYVKYERFDDYWRGRPNLEYVIVKLIPDSDTSVAALERGEVDLAFQIGSQLLPVLEANPNIEVNANLIDVTNQFTAFNLRVWPTNDIRFRRAIHMAINYAEAFAVANPFGSLERKYGFLHNSFASGQAPWAYNPAIEDEFPEYDLDEAKRLIAELQAEQPIPTLRVSGMAPGMVATWSEYLATLLETELGLDVDHQLFIGPPIMDEMMSKQWHLITMAFAGGFPQTYMPVMYGSQSGIIPLSGAPPPPGAPPPGAPPPGAPPPGGLENWAGYVNTDVDNYLLLAEAQMDLEDMANYYYLAEREAVKDLPYIWDYHWIAPLAYRTDLIGDVEAFPTGAMIYLFNSEHNVYKK